MGQRDRPRAGRAQALGACSRPRRASATADWRVCAGIGLARSLLRGRVRWRERHGRCRARACACQIERGRMRA